VSDTFAAPSLPPGRTLDLPGRGRTFIREVAGPPGAPTLLLLHGLGATADLNWFTAYSALGRHFHVVAMDHRGHGRGIRSRTRFRLADCADDAAAVCDALGISSVVAVGYSMGGPISQLLWQRHRSLVSGLVLCATSRNFAGHPREQAMFMTMPVVSGAARLVPGNVWRRVGDRTVGRRVDGQPFGAWAASELRRSSAVAVLEAASAIGRYSSHAWIGEIDVPTAVVVTTKDDLVPARRQRRLAESIPGATVVEVDADHLACVTAASRFVPALVDACRVVTSGSLTNSA
jgi:pimeloyl-ACP methyl ester carboxylesterase